MKIENLNSNIKANLHKQNEEKAYEKKIQVIANNLIQQLRVPLGNHLIYLLDAPKAKNNEQAVKEWLKSNTTRFELNELDFEQLKVKLKMKLEDDFYS